MKIGILVGHGKSSTSGYDSGAVSKKYSYHEFKICKEITKSCVDELKSYNCSVELVNYNGDKNLLERIKYVNANKFDFIVEIHLNSHTTSSANGTECYYYATDNAGKKVAISLCDNISKEFKTVNRGAKEGSNFGIVRQTNCTALLLECLFISNDEVLKLKDAQGTNHMGLAIADSIVACYNLEYNSLKVGDEVVPNWDWYVTAIEGDMVTIASKTGKCKVRCQSKNVKKVEE